MGTNQIAEGYALVDEQGVLSVSFGTEPVAGLSNYIVLKTDNNYSSFVWVCEDNCDRKENCQNIPYAWILNRTPIHANIETEDMISQMMRIISSENPDYPVDELRKNILVDDNSKCQY